MVITQELREVMKQNQQHTQSALNDRKKFDYYELLQKQNQKKTPTYFVQQLGWFSKLSITQKGGKKFEKINQQLMEYLPTLYIQYNTQYDNKIAGNVYHTIPYLLLSRWHQEFCYKSSVGNELQP